MAMAPATWVHPTGAAIVRIIATLNLAAFQDVDVSVYLNGPSGSARIVVGTLRVGALIGNWVVNIPTVDSVITVDSDGSFDSSTFLTVELIFAP